MEASDLDMMNSDDFVETLLAGLDAGDCDISDETDVALFGSLFGESDFDEETDYQNGEFGIDPLED